MIRSDRSMIILIIALAVTLTKLINNNLINKHLDTSPTNFYKIYANNNTGKVKQQNTLKGMNILAAILPYTVDRNKDLNNYIAN